MGFTKTNATVYTVLLTAALSASGWAGSTFYDDYTSIKTKLELTHNINIEQKVEYLATKDSIKRINDKLDNLGTSVDVVHVELYGIRESINKSALVTQAESKKDMKYLLDKIDGIGK